MLDPPHFNASLRARILAHKHVLYEDSRVVQEFERFFLAAPHERGVVIAPGSHPTAPSQCS